MNVLEIEWKALSFKEAESTGALLSLSQDIQDFVRRNRDADPENAWIYAYGYKGAIIGYSLCRPATLDELQEFARDYKEAFGAF